MLQARLLLLMMGLALHLCGVVAFEISLIQNVPWWAKTMVVLQFFGIGTYPVYLSLRSSNESVHDFFIVFLGNAAPETLKRSMRSSPQYPMTMSRLQSVGMMVVDFLLYILFLYALRLGLKTNFVLAVELLGVLLFLLLFRFGIPLLKNHSKISLPWQS